MNFKDARVILIDVPFREGFQISADYIRQFHRVRLQKGALRVPYSAKLFNLSDVELPDFHSGPVPLQREKVQDLEDLCIFINPASKQDYFRNIIRKQRALPPPTDEPVVKKRQRGRPHTVYAEDSEDEVEDHLLDFDF